MAGPPGLIASDIGAYLHAQEHKSLLRFITCGSVDDGKSTLIGRLLYDSKMIFEDQLAALEADSKRVGTQGENIDFALLGVQIGADVVRDELGLVSHQKYPSCFLRSMEAAASWSITRPWRSEVRVSSISWMMAGSVSALLSMAPVSG